MTNFTDEIEHLKKEMDQIKQLNALLIKRIIFAEQIFDNLNHLNLPTKTIVLPSSNETQEPKVQVAQIAHTLNTSDTKTDNAAQNEQNSTV